MIWLLLAFLGNGLAQFFQKFLHASGLGHLQAPALIMMYVAGSLIAWALMIGFKGRIGRKEMLAGGGVALCSYAGNFAVLRALGTLPAYTVFPLVVGGSIAVVALVSWLLLGEKLSPAGKLGVGAGIAAALLLTL